MTNRAGNSKFRPGDMVMCKPLEDQVWPLNKGLTPGTVGVVMLSPDYESDTNLLTVRLISGYTGEWFCGRFMKIDEQTYALHVLGD